MLSCIRRILQWVVAGAVGGQGVNERKWKRKVKVKG